MRIPSDAVRSLFPSLFVAGLSAGSLVALGACGSPGGGRTDAGGARDIATIDATSESVGTDGADRGETTTVTCNTDADCSDGVFCNGVERCSPGAAGANASGCVAASPPMACPTGQTCDEAGRRCMTGCTTDADGDGHRSIACGGDDCDDNDAQRYPNNPEICDAAGHDEDCDPCTVAGSTAGSGDADMDMYVSAACYNTYTGAAPTACDPTRVAVNTTQPRVVGTDCNDTNASINPGTSEACNRLDDNCNGLTDESLATQSYYPDCDHDTFGVLATAIVGCAPPAGGPTSCASGGWSTTTTDCNDNVASINPGGAELCNGLDDDCNGLTDDNVVNQSYYPDCDRDLFGASATPIVSCAPPSGGPTACAAGAWATSTGDCMDTNAVIHPGATEICNGVDDDCNGLTDDNVVNQSYYPDCDRDLYGASATPAVACAPPLSGPTACPAGAWATSATDCADTNATIHPGATEVCNGVDDDCNGLTDDNVATLSYYPDCDRDLYGASVAPVVACALPLSGPTACPAGAWATSATDCADANATVHPGATEVCNGVDDDCNGMTDEGLAFVSYYSDCDHDLYGGMVAAMVACSAPTAGPIACPVGGWVTNAQDCNDINASINPGSAEVCNRVDDNCNGISDEGLPTQSYYQDCDRDLHGALGSAPVVACSLPLSPPVACVAGAWAGDATDCNDGNASVSPGASEVCNRIDDNCNGMTDEGLPTLTYYPDCDRDLYGAVGGTPVTACALPTSGPPVCPAGGWATSATDCNDLNASVHPGVAELCNGIDDDCNGLTDDNVINQSFYPDCDRDMYGIAATPVVACSPPAVAPASCATGAWATNTTDCNDTFASINPGASEVCNRIDDNCNGMTDESLPLLSYYPDCDGDGYGSNSVAAVVGCSAPSTPPVCAVGVGAWVTNHQDCNDGASSVSPPNGAYACPGMCGTDTNILACGLACSVCTAPIGGSPTCAGGSCGFVCNAGYFVAGTQCGGENPPRPIAPLSTAVVTSQRPTLRWALGTLTDGARVEICQDRACTMLVTTINAPGTSARLATALPAGLYFWRLRPMLGSAAGTSTSPTWQFTVGARSPAVDTSWGSYPDVNGDGYSDMMVGYSSAGVYVRFGMPIGATLSVYLPPPTGSMRFGSSVASAGDVNGDGYSDIVVGDKAVAKAYVFLGSATGPATTPATTLTGIAATNFGGSVASAGDVNADGYADVVIGADATSTNAGAVYVYLGGAMGLATTPARSLAGSATSLFGHSVASAGDVNGDGFADLVLGAPGTNQVFVYTGGATGIGAAAAATLSGTAATDYGASVACAGDVNADGYADVVVGAWLANTVYVYSGASGGLGTTAATTLTRLGKFGWSVSGSGDVTGDGYGDVIVGAYGNDAAYLYLGATGGLATVVTSTASGVSGDQYGYSVAGAGDTNRDGFADVIVGAPFNAYAELWRGRASGLPASSSATYTLGGNAGTSVASTRGANRVDPVRACPAVTPAARTVRRGSARRARADGQ